MNLFFARSLAVDVESLAAGVDRRGVGGAAIAMASLVAMLISGTACRRIQVEDTAVEFTRADACASADAQRGNGQGTTGTMDTYHLNNSTTELEKWMKTTENPHYEGFFMYGDRKPHCWSGPLTPAERIKEMAQFIAAKKPEGATTPWWP